jgi:flagellar protein FlgJ
MQIGTLGSAAALSEGASTEHDPRLKSAAHEFEASLMQEFLKPLQHDALFADDKGGSSSEDEGSDGALMSFGSQAMAKAISERGGFGIATQILKHFGLSDKPDENTLRSDGHS